MGAGYKTHNYCSKCKRWELKFTGYWELDPKGRLRCPECHNLIRQTWQYTENKEVTRY